RRGHAGAPPRAREKRGVGRGGRGALSRPSPEDLGLIPAKKTEAKSHDWNVLHRRLGQLGVHDFRLDKTPGGGYRATLLLPTGQKNHTQHIEAPGNTEAEAVCLALDRAEEWSKRTVNGGSE